MSSQVLAPSTESAMLARILQADEQELSLDAARYWLSVKLPATDQDRVDELSARARAGSLTEAEGEERRCSGGVLTGRNLDRAPGVRARIPKREI